MITMKKVAVVFINILCISFTFQNAIIEYESKEERSFSIDYDNNTFLMNGKPFRFISGSFHYFRALPETWQQKLRTMRSAGLNAVTTYVEWSLHNPKEDKYEWTGIADLIKFIQLAEAEDLYVILRPGPYICAERDMGGFPYWLLRKYPKIQLRTNDINYKKEVRLWYSQLMPRIVPYLFENGGPIIMVQIENEYGSFSSIDESYKNWLRNETKAYIRDKAILFTTDGPYQLARGHITDVFATIDFGSNADLNYSWGKLREYQPNGPLVNSEFYPGWLTHWQEQMQRVKSKPVINTLREMLKDGASVNFYMFFGGTNFGFTAGANNPPYSADVTSYDYDAPMDESGDPTQKYFDIREVIGEFLTLPDLPIPLPTHKEHYGVVKLIACCSLLSHDGKLCLSDGQAFSKTPQTFEALDQYSGLVLYETELPRLKKDPSLLKIMDIRDRAYVYINRDFVGVLSRQNSITSLSILPEQGRKLQILVENQGRINYGIPNDFKGILSDVILNNEILYNWNMTKYPLENYQKIENIVKKNINKTLNSLHGYKGNIKMGPILFFGEFYIDKDDLYDTYFDPTGWGKGVVFINGFNLGRYWPVVGPQITLYVPKELLKRGTNRIVLIEYQKISPNSNIILTNIPNLDGN